MQMMRMKKPANLFIPSTQSGPNPDRNEQEIRTGEVLGVWKSSLSLCRAVGRLSRFCAAVLILSSSFRSRASVKLSITGNIMSVMVEFLVEGSKGWDVGGDFLFLRVNLDFFSGGLQRG